MIKQPAGCSLLGYRIFDPEDGSTTFLQNVGDLLAFYRAPYSRSHHCEKFKLNTEVQLFLNRYKCVGHRMDTDMKGNR
jgi:hypothetical protein